MPPVSQSYLLGWWSDYDSIGGLNLTPMYALHWGGAPGVLFDMLAEDREIEKYPHDTTFQIYQSELRGLTNKLGMAQKIFGYSYGEISAEELNWIRQGLVQACEIPEPELQSPCGALRLADTTVTKFHWLRFAAVIESICNFMSHRDCALAIPCDYPNISVKQLMDTPPCEPDSLTGLFLDTLDYCVLMMNYLHGTLLDRENHDALNTLNTDTRTTR